MGCLQDFVEDNKHLKESIKKYGEDITQTTYKAAVFIDCWNSSVLKHKVTADKCEIMHKNMHTIITELNIPKVFVASYFPAKPTEQYSYKQFVKDDKQISALQNYDWGEIQLIIEAKELEDNLTLEWEDTKWPHFTINDLLEHDILPGDDIIIGGIGFRGCVRGRDIGITPCLENGYNVYIHRLMLEEEFEDLDKDWQLALTGDEDYIFSEVLNSKFYRVKKK